MLNLGKRSLLKITVSALCVAATTQMVHADEPIPVVATFSILGNMVSEIGGEHVNVTTLVGPDGDAHVYQPTPKDARSVSEAELMFMNGLEFEGWLERLVKAASFDGSLVVATDGIRAIGFDDHNDHDDHDDHKDHDDHDDHKDHDDHDDHDDHKDHDDHDDHDDHSGHNHGAFDPHAWHSLTNAAIYIDNITAALAKADPSNAGDYYSNRAKYLSELDALSKDVASMMADIDADKRTVVTPHDAFGYFSVAYDVTFEAPQGLSTESEASAADVARLIEQIREQNISAVFIESISDNRLIEQIANETGASVGGTLYSDALSSSDGPASTYLDMFRHNAKTISDALK